MNTPQPPRPGEVRARSGEVNIHFARDTPVTSVDFARRGGTVGDRSPQGEVTKTQPTKSPNHWANWDHHHTSNGHHHGR